MAYNMTPEIEEIKKIGLAISANIGSLVQP